MIKTGILTHLTFRWRDKTGRLLLLLLAATPSAVETLRHLRQMRLEIRPSLPVDQQLRRQGQSQTLHGLPLLPRHQSLLGYARQRRPGGQWTSGDCLDILFTVILIHRYHLILCYNQ